MAKMDDQKNKQIYEALKEDCKWNGWNMERRTLGFKRDMCMVGIPCTQENCVPLTFAIYFNRPEVNNG